MNSASALSARNSLANAWPASSWRPETTMRLPSRANARAAARPKPVRAPVIKTTGYSIIYSLARPIRAVGAGYGFPSRRLKRLCRVGAIPVRYGRPGMELRHLRYFVAVAEEGSVTLAASRRLHTAQPSLSRQLRDLEREVGAQLLVRTVRGIELTAAGRAFLDHARLALSQVEAAGEAARRAAHPAKESFGMGFLTGTEMDWFTEAVRLLRDELPSIEVILVSQTSPELASGLLRGKVDVAFLRPE